MLSTTRRIPALVASDYLAAYAYKRQTERRLRLLMLPRLLTNASMHANILFRLMTGMPRATSFVWRRLLISLHSCDIARDCSFGPGLELPHPFGIAIGADTMIGAGVVLHHNVSAGPAPRRWTPESRDGTLTIADGVVLFPGAQVLAAIHIGEAAQIGANCVVAEDIPAGWIVTRNGARPPREPT